VTSDRCHGSTISSADCIRKLNHAQKVGQLYRSSDAGFSLTTFLPSFVVHIRTYLFDTFPTYNPKDNAYYSGRLRPFYDVDDDDGE